jgi:UDP-N-acetylmuramoyl-tripeptide--D-alanyl-D-alanine ligase
VNLSVKDILQLDYESTINLNSMKNRTFNNISIDSRTVKPGGLFFAIRGEKLDGHRFIKNAFANGAICAVVDTLSDKTAYANIPSIIVKDTVKAFGSLASLYRQKFKIPVVAIAGSNGKTTTKEMIAKILATKFNVLSTEGNLNNHIGVPQTLFRLRKKHQIAVIEIGTNHFGEIKYLSEILRPTHGIITNIGNEHLEYFKTVQGVARAEGELFDWLKNEGTIFVNTDDRWIIKRAERAKRKITFGVENSRANISVRLKNVDLSGCSTFNIKQRGREEFRVKLSVPGTHTMKNALAAAAVGMEFGINGSKISSSLTKFHAVDKRMEISKHGSITLINDTYNANSDSMLSALDSIEAIECKGKKILIIADMLELGTSSIKEHQKIGKAISSNNCDYLLTYGDLAKIIHQKASVDMKYHYEQKNILSEYASELISKGDVVLVKGSRGMKMEDVVLFLKERLDNKR